MHSIHSLGLPYLVKAEAAFTKKARHCLTLVEEGAHQISQIAHSVLQDSRDRTTLKKTNIPQLLGSVTDSWRKD